MLGMDGMISEGLRRWQGEAMRYLVDAPVRTAQELSWQLSAIDDGDQLEAAILESLFEVFHADHCGLNEFVPERPDPVRLRIYPHHPSIDSVLAGVANQFVHRRITDHPVMNHYFDLHNSPQPVRLSDLVSDRALRRTVAYDEVLRPIGGNYQIVVVTRREGVANATGYGLTRSRPDFPDSALAIAQAVQPVLVALSAAQQTRVTPQPVTSGHSLTSRELDILRLVEAGMTATAIGHARRISPRTVRKHLEHIYAKLGHHDRLGAVLHARRLGLLGYETLDMSSGHAGLPMK
jgi:DNA-binding CsgD family transcriptional regulator